MLFVTPVVSANIIIGEAIKMHGRDKFIISGKFGAIKNADGSFGIDGSPANARKSVEESLKRLGSFLSTPPVLLTMLKGQITLTFMR